MKKLKTLLGNKSHQEIWDTYCGFLDLSMEQYMEIQNSLLLEQIRRFGAAEIGNRFFGTTVPATVEEFRQRVPLTKYEDYADILLSQDEEKLPEKAELWIQTTWEGGLRPVKKAPYTREMLDVFRDRMVACMLLSTGSRKGEFFSENGDKMLYGLAPLPFATGLVPVMLDESLDMEILPPAEEAVKMSFSERNKKGFQLAMQKGVDYFFGLGSVVYRVSKSFAAVAGKENLKPKHVFRLKGLLVAGTDSSCYKDDLEDLWGVRPLECFAGTEPSVVGTENWSRNGMYFFPDTCFYEFIRKEDMLRSLKDEEFIPDTCLMNEVQVGEEYELVISVLHGGAFVRYRIGDMFRCVGIGEEESNIKLPRFAYVDRRPDVIDIAGFTRITERETELVIKDSGLPVLNWKLCKEFAENHHPYLHLYLEMKEENRVDMEEIKARVDASFRKMDEDYENLNQLLGMEPLKISVNFR